MTALCLTLCGWCVILGACVGQWPSVILAIAVAVAIVKLEK